MRVRWLEGIRRMKAMFEGGGNGIGGLNTFLMLPTAAGEIDGIK